MVDIESAGASLNLSPALIAFCEECSAEDRAAAAAAMLAVAGERLAAAPPKGGEGGEDDDGGLVFCTATEAGGGIGGQVRRLCGLTGGEGKKGQLVLLDIPDDGGFYVAEGGGAADAAAIRAFLAAYDAKTLARRQLGK